jgi:hypothetical protein
MATISKTIRIEPAFDDPEFVRTIFQRHALYRTMAGYLPTKAQEAPVLGEQSPEATRRICPVPSFRPWPGAKCHSFLSTP